MVLNLQNIIQPTTNEGLTIIVQNHRDKSKHTIPKGSTRFSLGRWLDSGHKRTELIISNTLGQTATITLEDSNWYLIVAGNIKGGWKGIRVGGSRDFDLTLTDDEKMELKCWEGTWGDDNGDTLTFELAPSKS